MYLKSLHIKNFRSIKDTNITFNKGLNILIGPNNSGKTTIIDALRICFSYKDYHSIHITEDDFYKTKSSSNKKYSDIEFDLSFCPVEDFEKAVFIELYNPTTKTLDLRFTFSYNAKKERVQSKVFGGSTKENPISDEIFDFILNIYLSALRDANRYLTPGRHNILSSFFSKLVSDEDKKEMMNEINNNINNSKLSDMIDESTEKYIENHFKSMIFNEDSINLLMSPIDQDFDSFTKNWKIQLPFGDFNHLELHQNGLGYNNLIYISILLSNLDAISKNNEESLYISLCIEEPEAHLHPQLQNSFFSYLNKINENTNLQIFVTSHSPTLTSKADLNSLILVQNNGNNVTTKNLVNLFHNKDDINFLKKFLDVTKSQLLFAKKIIFVEGFTEALLIPLFAKIYDFDLDKHGVEVVNVVGISFKRFMPLFDEDNDLDSKGAILTDDDKSSLLGEPSNACKKIREYENKKLKVFCSKKTFEFDLIETNSFNPIIWKVFKNKHPSIFKEVDGIQSLFDVFNGKQRHNIKKTEIALDLSEKLINCNNPDIIPAYIKEAFDYLKGEHYGDKLD